MAACHLRSRLESRGWRLHHSPTHARQSRGPSLPCHPNVRAVAGAQDCASPLQVADIASELHNSIVVLGAGPAGLAAAVALKQLGLPVAVLERRSVGGAGGTALGLWTSAWRALDALGAAEPLRRQHPSLERIELCREDGRLLRAFTLAECEGGPHEFRGVRRSSLLAALEARLPPATVRHGYPVVEVQTTVDGATLTLQGGRQIDCLAVVAADGVRSVALLAAGRRLPRLVGQTAIRGVAKLDVPADALCIRQLWSVGPRAGMYPLSDSELYWFVCFDDPGALDSALLQPEDMRREALAVVGRSWRWGIREAVEATPPEALTRSRIADRWDPPWAASAGTVALAGDALHPMTPNLGQGGGVALEDAVVLSQALAAQPGLVERVAGLAGKCGSSSGSRAAAVAGIRAAVQRYEAERLRRSLPITIRSHLMGAALQSSVAPVAAARDLVVQRAFRPAHFLAHAVYDCGAAEV